MFSEYYELARGGISSKRKNAGFVGELAAETIDRLAYVPIELDAPDADADYGLWGPIGVWREMESIIKWLYLMLREDGATRETLSTTVEQTLESAEGEYRHGWPGLMQHKDVETTVTIETLDDVDVESGEYELRPSSR